MKKKFLTMLILLIMGLPAKCQQTVFNVPSADVTPKGFLYFEHESQFQPWNPDAFWIGTHYSAYGVGHNTEIGASLFNLNTGGWGNMALGVGFKSSIPIKGLNEKFPQLEPKFIVGSEVLTGLVGNGVGNWTYAALSGRIPKVKTRVTAGASFATTQLWGENTVSAMMAVEQPITEKLTLQADWYSGRVDDLGLLIVGASYKLPKYTTLIVGYQIPNTVENGHCGFVVEIAKMFDLNKKSDKTQDELKKDELEDEKFEFENVEPTDSNNENNQK